MIRKDPFHPRRTVQKWDLLSETVAEKSHLSQRCLPAEDGAGLPAGAGNLPPDVSAARPAESGGVWMSPSFR